MMGLNERGQAISRVYLWPSILQCEIATLNGWTRLLVKKRSDFVSSMVGLLVAAILNMHD